MRSCREIVRLVGSHTPLSLREKIAVTVHFARCKSCTVYSQQLSAMQRGFRSLLSELTNADPKEVDRLKADIKKNIIRPNCPSSGPKH